MRGFNILGIRLLYNTIFWRQLRRYFQRQQFLKLVKNLPRIKNQKGVTVDNKVMPLKVALIFCVICLFVGAGVVLFLQPTKSIKKDYEQKIEEKTKTILDLKNTNQTLIAENEKLKIGFKEKIRIAKKANGDENTEIDREYNLDQNNNRNTANNTQGSATIDEDRQTNTNTRAREDVQINPKRYGLGPTLSARQDLGLEFVFPVFWNFNGKLEPSYNFTTGRPDIKAGVLYFF